MAGPARGNITIDIEEGKGRGGCVGACPPKRPELAPEVSSYGVHAARCTGADCTGCVVCVDCCPEPGAIIVYRLAPPPKAAAAQAQPGGEHAAALSRQRRCHPRRGA